MRINIENGKIEIDVFELIKKMTKEEKMMIVESVTWDEILNEAVKRLTGEAKSWAGDDKLLTLEVLSKMENHLTSGYKWSVLCKLRDAARDMSYHEHLYWKMYHDEQHGDLFKQWLKTNGYDSNYTNEFKSYKNFIEMVENKLEELKS